jgi:pyruvate,water dikinase
MKNEIKGTPVFPGTVTGPVSIVKDYKDIQKIKPGDILVAVETKPDFVIAISKAAAIITDVGGITSHAAIIAREFGTPCIVGTEKATKLLNDGDIIEVDAHKGIIKKINNNRRTK